MIHKTAVLKFQDCYQSASIVEAAATDFKFFEEINWESVGSRLFNYSKISILHEYIFSVLAVTTRWEYHGNSDSYTQKDVEYQTGILKDYGIIPHSVTPDKLHALLSDDADNEIDFYKWFQFQEEKYIEFWGKLTEEVFHLLFANRTFLLRFNIALSEYLRSGKVTIPAEFLNDRGRLKRSYIPVWAKKAVYYRDHGRCVLCQKDLSGLLSIDRNLHYDHIVPLNLFGTNDPCNLQLLCESCNLEKSGELASTGIRYSAWW